MIIIRWDKNWPDYIHCNEISHSQIRHSENYLKQILKQLCKKIINLRQKLKKLYQEGWRKKVAGPRRRGSITDLVRWFKMKRSS